MMKNLLMSAAIGDISGQPYEFKGRTKDYDFVNLLYPKNTYTDDTVCTFACAEALLHDLDMAQTLWTRCRADFYRGFGGRFAHWLTAKEVGPAYGSFGNGSGMRVSAAGFMAKTKEECIEMATRTAMPTHNHPEGIKGAVATALAIFYGMQGQDKDFVRTNVLDEYYPEWSDKTYAEIKPGYYFDETCQLTIPAAIICFLESKDYEDCLKLAISLGGDADTLAAIAGPMAYAHYKEMPQALIDNAKAKLPEWMLQLNDEFDEYCHTLISTDSESLTNDSLCKPMEKKQANREYNGEERPEFTPEKLSYLKDDEVFVFGSNLAGHHAGGAARAAVMRFGAVWGQGVGLQGQSYAIPTMQGGVETIKPYVDDFIAFACGHTELFFYVTRIGCGIAGFKDEDIAPLFADAIGIENIRLPKSFVEILRPNVPKELMTMMYGQVRTMVDLLKALNANEPIKDADDAEKRLEEIMERNVRYGDDYAFMALRTVWCLLSQYQQNGEGVDIERLEKDMMGFHKDYQFFGKVLEGQILYNYSVAKMIKYIQFVNEFKRFKSYREIEEILPSIGFSHCSENNPNYYYSFNRFAVYRIISIMWEEWENISKDGVLDNEAFEDVMFGRFDRMVKKYGIKEAIRRGYGQVGCHPEIQAPIRSCYSDTPWGPIYVVHHDGRIEKGCNDFRRYPWTNTAFEMKFASKLLDDDPNYRYVEGGWRGGYYVPVEDFTLPVYCKRGGKVHYDSEEEKRKAIMQILAKGDVD